MSNARDLSILGNGPAFSAGNSAQQSLTTGVYAKITLDTEDFDTNNCFASSRFTPNVAGFYQINAQLYVSGSTGTVTTALASIYKNGTAYQIGSYGKLNNDTNGVSTVSVTVEMNGSTDYIELYGVVYGTSPIVIAASGGSKSRMSGHLVRGT